MCKEVCQKCYKESGHVWDKAAEARWERDWVDCTPTSRPHGVGLWKLSKGFPPDDCPFIEYQMAADDGVIDEGSLPGIMLRHYLDEVDRDPVAEFRMEVEELSKLAKIADPKSEEWKDSVASSFDRIHSLFKELL